MVVYLFWTYYNFNGEEEMYLEDIFYTREAAEEAMEAYISKNERFYVRSDVEAQAIKGETH